MPDRCCIIRSRLTVVKHLSHWQGFEPCTKQDRRASRRLVLWLAAHALHMFAAEVFARKPLLVSD